MAPAPKTATRSVMAGVRSTRSARSGDAFERGGDGASAAQAERREPVAALPPVQLVEQGRDDPGAAGTDRMTERDRPAVDVDLRPFEAELATVREGLGGERLVDLDEIERLDRQLDPIEEAAHALDLREEQPPRRHLGLGVAHDPGKRLQPEALDGAFAGHDRRRGAVGDARCVAGRDRADDRRATILALGQRERRLEPRQRLDGRVAAGVLVDADDRLSALPIADRDRRDLGVEPAGVDRLDRSALTLERECVLVLAGDAVVDRDTLRMGAHVAVLDRAPQAVVDRRVDELAVPEAEPEAG